MGHDTDDAARARDISPRCRVSARFPVRSFGVCVMVGVVVVVIVVVVLPQRVSKPRSRTPVCEGRRFKRQKKIRRRNKSHLFVSTQQSLLRQSCR